MSGPGPNVESGGLLDWLFQGPHYVQVYTCTALKEYIAESGILCVHGSLLPGHTVGPIRERVTMVISGPIVHTSMFVML